MNQLEVIENIEFAEKMPKCKRILVKGEIYVGDFLDYEVFVAGWLFEQKPEMKKIITEDVIATIKEEATRLRFVEGIDPSWNLDNSTRGRIDRFKFSFDWNNNQILVCDD